MGVEGIRPVWLGIGLVRFLRLSVLANLIATIDLLHLLAFGITRGWWRHLATR
jgi:hypothetical protein